MLEVKVCRYDDLSEESQRYFQYYNGQKESANFLLMIWNGEIIFQATDLMEVEDATFGRDLSWVASAIRQAYYLGKQVAKENLSDNINH